jgi:hypothetical protein
MSTDDPNNFNNGTTVNPLEDIVGSRYIINVTTPLEHLSNIFCRVYKATDTQTVESSSDNETEYLAYIFNPSLPFRTRAFHLLHNYSEDEIIKPLAYSNAYFSLSKSQHFTIITTKPPGLSFIEYIAQHGPVSENFITDIFLPSMVRTLQNLEIAGLSHGSISPNNIYIHNNNIFLGECFSTAPGFNQPVCYEALERIMANPYGKGEPDLLTDLFALGVVCLFLITGQDPGKIAEEDTMIRNRLAIGSYQFFIPNYNNISNRMRDLLRGLLSDKRNERWKLNNINDWIHNRKYSVLNVSDNNDASRNIIFDSKHYINYRSLAYALSQEWEIAKVFLKEDILIKWAETSLADIDKAEKLHYLLRSSQQSSSSEEEKDENVVKTILILNPESPIFFKEIATYIEGIPYYFAYAYSQGKRELLDYLLKIIIYSLWKGSTIGIRSENRKEITGILENILPYANKKGLGFGPERYLYELCPQLSCQSTILEGNYIDSLEDLLLFIDKKSQEKNIEIVDNHLASYLTAKLNITSDVKFSNQPELARFEKNRELILLYLLSSAQKITKATQLLGLSELAVKKANSTIDLIYNRKTKEDMLNKLDNVKNKGDLVEIFKIIANPYYIKNDQEGFNKACIEYKILREQLEIVNQPAKIYEVGYKYGLKLSVILSYLICLIVFAILISDYIT